ncbi:MAG: GH32 C-terminal domain-containing protein, partial [Prevotella sp.]|nr:GH32 C-terminal domain-containing protein [Prevotella sp.]
LTNHATQLAVAVGRITDSYAPGLFGSGEGGQNNDVWGSQPIIGNVDGQIYDHSGHDIYKGMTFTSGLYERSIYPLISSGKKMDHNCMWDLNNCGLAPNPNVVKSWEDQTNSTVLGTWNHVVDYCCAGIVDFAPTTNISGRILAVGLAAYDWSMGNANTYLDQLQMMTANCLSYLGYKKSEGGGGGSETGDYAAHFNMTTDGGSIKELVSGSSYNIVSQLPVCSVSGLDGDALRFDGYSNYVKAGLPVSTLNKETLTVTVRLAAESYPMMQVDAAETTPTYATICGNLDETGKKGFAFQLSSQGDLRLKIGVVYPNNNNSTAMITIDGNQKLPRGQWNELTMVYDKTGNAVNFYLNGTSIGNKRTNQYDLNIPETDFFIGKDATETKSGPFLINTFCGAIDDIAISNSATAPSAFTPQPADFNYPAERYQESLWRPQFHGMPSGSWTNESHGLIYSNGKYHVFFQKNANGPYMSRLHWGHISSENLYKWTEEPIAVYPGESFDIKGCWSGCVYDDNGTATILYTGVDNAKARIIKTTAKDNTLVGWQNKSVIIDGRPSGLSDDFRDPYYFEANGNKYVIVGTSKNNIGACTLHKLNGTNWTNDGTIFFQGGSQSQHGKFWEMPNVTPMGDGKWLFTCTPLETNTGVRTLCWVGTIGTDGKFTPDGNGVQYLEMGGVSRDGYGLLSPSIYQKDGKTLLLGIVPDKLASEENYKMGWAHNFSLPREISLDANGLLVQKPYSGLTGMRTSTSVTKDLTLIGSESLSPVSGRQIELLGEFTVSNGTCGFNFLKSGDKQASLTYDVSNGTLSLDLSSLNRTVNDGGVYKGVYTATLPKKVNVGETLKLNVFLDGSILDIFVNDTWAYSVRVFPTDANAVEAEVFASSSTAVKASAWVLDANQSGGTGIVEIEECSVANNCYYDLQGRRLNGVPQKGIYITNGKKYVAR